MAVPWRVKLLGKLRAKNPGRSSEVVKYRRHSLDFAKTNMNPDEPRSPRGGRARGTLTSRAWVLPRRWSGPPVKDFAETPPRGAFGRGTLRWEQRGKGCLFSLPRQLSRIHREGSPDLHDAKRSCHGTLGTKRSTARRCRAADPIVFLLRTIIPLIRGRPATRGCFEAFLPLQPVSHQRRSREAGGRFPYR
jgi:hypothetical protein